MDRVGRLAPAKGREPLTEARAHDILEAGEIVHSRQQYVVATNGVQFIRTSNEGAALRMYEKLHSLDGTLAKGMHIERSRRVIIEVELVE